MILLYVIAGILAVWYIFRTKKKTPNAKVVPGPKGLPIVGKGLEITPDKLHLILSKYAEKYGDIVQLDVFADKLICLNSADLIRKAFNNDPYKKFMNDRPLTFWGKYILNDSQSIAFYPQAFNKVHGDMRKGLTRALHVYGDGINEFEEKVLHELRRLHDDIDGRNGEDFEFTAVMKRSLSNVLAFLLTGEEFADDDVDVNLFWQLDYTNEYMLNPSTNAIWLSFPFLVNFPGYYKKVYSDSMDARRRILRRFMYNVRKTHTSGTIRGIVDFLLEEQAREKEAGGEVVFTDDRLESNILETIAAAILTTLSSISNTILILINEPGYQERVQEELDMVIGRDWMPSIEDRANCPLLEAIITESTRYITPVPLLLSHYCASEEEFEGYHLPAGSVIIPIVWKVHHDEAVWGDPWTFRPERWLDNNGEVIPSTHPLRKHWLVFGTGRRQCVGEQFARSRLFLFLASLLKTYTFTGTPDKCGPCDPKIGSFDVSLIMRTKPFHCKATKRF